MSLAGFGFSCPQCHQDEYANVTARLIDDEGYDIGITLHCIKCEHVWDDIFASGRDREIAKRERI